MSVIHLGDRAVGEGQPTYFIADISANHDGELSRAIDLIHLAAEAGADAAKFQNFRAAHIVSDHGFRELGSQLSHQAKWKRSVFEVYEDASLPWEWTGDLREACDDAGIQYCSTPYDLPAVDMLDPHVPFYKVGSGDITWPDILQHIASKGKPVLLATGASSIGEVQEAVNTLREQPVGIGLMQCNTNYTGSLENFRHIHLNVLKTYRVLFPDVVLGLSDHTPAHATVLGAVALGARIVEKHFTDDTSREGPDHPFSMTQATWREMVDRARELEHALGSSEKFIADNEQQTVVVQRRCLRAGEDIPEGTKLDRTMIDVLRPAPQDAIKPGDLERVLGQEPVRDIKAGEALRWSLLAEPGGGGG